MSDDKAPPGQKLHRNSGRMERLIRVSENGLLHLFLSQHLKVRGREAAFHLQGYCVNYLLTGLLNDFACLDEQAMKR